jgi:hypothetical protein
LSNHLRRLSTVDFDLVVILVGRRNNHESTSGYKPNAPGSMYTIPHLETVAGDATAKSSTSNIIVI